MLLLLPFIKEACFLSNPFVKESKSENIQDLSQHKLIPRGDVKAPPNSILMIFFLIPTANHHLM